MGSLFASRRLIPIMVPGLFALSMVLSAMAEAPATNSKSLADNGTKSSRAASASVDREAEQVVLQLVQSHLPELTGVLKQLRTSQPREYEVAIKELFKAARKLEFAQNRDQRLFEIEVELLQAEQQASLLMAKLKVRDSQSDRRRLRDAAERLQRAQIARAEYDVEALRARLARTQQQFDAAVARLETRTNDTNQQLEKAYLSMLRKAGRDTRRNDSDQSDVRAQSSEPTNPPSSNPSLPESPAPN